MKAGPSSISFVVLMSLLGALAAFATDMALSATAPMARDFGVAAGGIGLTLSAFMISFALSPLVYGPLSDRFGRRPVALFACLVYVIGSIGCTTAHSLGAMLVWRFVQGIGGGARPLALAIIGDHFQGAAAREKMSYVNALSLLAPLLAPLIGAMVLTVGDWRLIHGVLGTTGAVALILVWLQLEESLPPERRTAASPRAIAGHYASLFRNKRSVAFTIVAVGMFGVIFSYVSGSPLVMIGVFKLSPWQYGLTFALNSAGLLAGNLVNARLNAARVAPTVLLAIGLSLCAATAGALLVITWAGAARIEVFLPLVFVCMAGCAMANTNAIQLAIEPLSRIAGTASAAVVSTQLAISALAGFIVADTYDGRTATSTVAGMAFFGLLGWVAFVLRPSEKARPARGLLRAETERP